MESVESGGFRKMRPVRNGKKSGMHNLDEGQKGLHNGVIECGTGRCIALMTRGSMAKGATARGGTAMGGMRHNQGRHDKDPLPHPPPLSYHGGIY